MQLSPSVCHSIQTPQLVLVYILVLTWVFLVIPCSQVFQEMWGSSGKTARQIIQEKDLGLVSDTAQLHSVCQKVVDSHPDEVRAHMQIFFLFFFFSFLFFLLHVWDVLCLLCLSVGIRHQKWKQKCSEQADGAGSERDQRQSWPSFGEGNFTREDLMKVRLFITNETNQIVAYQSFMKDKLYNSNIADLY